ncbi:MAG: sulfatase-like hydrolase/transferase [Planctomycetota bacterium]|jgi:arylsulfatase A-like enzyme
MNMQSDQRWMAATGAVLLVLGLAVGTDAAESRRPNVLFIFADDQRADSIAAWGNAAIRTPHIDRLADSGFSFRANYCMGAMGGAVCVPSRAMVNTGLSLYHVRSDMRGAKLMPEVLRQNGYVTFGTGKWHNGEASYLRGFQKGKAIFFGGMSDHFNVPLADLAPDGELVNRRTGGKHSSELFVDAAIDFLRTHPADRPFYAYVAFTAPHDPRDPPLQHRQWYYGQRPPLPKNFMPQHPFDNGNMGGRDENLAPWPRTKEVVSDQLCEYYGLITHMDGQIGRLLAALKETGHADDTLIVYAADHGLAVGSHGLLGKQSIYEHSMKCPLIFTGPGIPKGQSQALTYLLDVFPTVCSLTGVDVPAKVEGKSLRPIWQGKADRVRDSLFLSFRHLMRSVRDDRWKLIRYPQINHTQLFDLENDPDELNNLADDPAQAERVEKMTALLVQWQKKVDDKQPLASDKAKPKEIDMTGRPRKPDRWQPKWIRDKYFGGAQAEAPKPRKRNKKRR